MGLSVARPRREGTASAALMGQLVLRFRGEGDRAGPRDRVYRGVCGAVRAGSPGAGRAAGERRPVLRGDRRVQGCRQAATDRESCVPDRARVHAPRAVAASRDLSRPLSRARHAGRSPARLGAGRRAADSRSPRDGECRAGDDPGHAGNGAARGIELRARRDVLAAHDPPAARSSRDHRDRARLRDRAEGSRGRLQGSADGHDRPAARRTAEARAEARRAGRSAPAGRASQQLRKEARDRRGRARRRRPHHVRMDGLRVVAAAHTGPREVGRARRQLLARTRLDDQPVGRRWRSARDRSLVAELAGAARDRGDALEWWRDGVGRVESMRRASEACGVLGVGGLASRAERSEDPR